MPVLVVALTAFPLAFFLTVMFQFPGTLLGFFLTGLTGGYLAGVSRWRGFYVGVVGSAIACLGGVVFLLAVMSRTPQRFDVAMYFANYFLWLNLAAPVNLFLVVIPIAAVGGAFGSQIRARTSSSRGYPNQRRAKESLAFDILDTIHRDRSLWKIPA